MDFVIRNPEDKEKLFLYLNRLPYTVNGWKLKIETIKKNRSNNQNRYMWYCFELIANETGEDRQRIHDYYVALFLTEKTIIFGTEIIISKGTSKLKTVEFEDFMQKVRLDAQEELSIIIPLPNEIIYDED